MQKKIHSLFFLLQVLICTNTQAQNCEASFFYENVLNSVTFYNNTTYNYTEAVWNFGDGTPPVSNPGIIVPHVYAASGVYNVCLTISDLTCSDTFCTTVYVCGYLSNFSYTISGLAVVFNNLSTGNYTKNIWDFGDGTTSLESNPVKAYAEPGLYDVCLILANDDFTCTQIFCESIAVSNSVNCVNTAQINPDNTCSNDWNPVCGCNNVTYTNPCKAFYQGGITSWTAGTCAGSCIAAFGSSVDLYTVTFNNYSVGGFTNTNWDFGDGTFSTNSNPTHTYASAGTYNVCLEISGNGCNATNCATIEITGLPECHAQFTVTQSCDVLQFNQTSNGTFTTMLWQLGDGTTAGSDTVNKTYSNPGNYNVCLTITGGGCQDTYCKLINIPDKNLVKAGFNSSFSVSALPVTVQFSGIDSFGAGFSYLWDFGDGTYSSEINVSHTYTSLCTPTVCFTVRDAYNCQDTKCKTLSLCTNSIEPILTTSQQIVCYPNPTNDIIRVLHKEKNLHHCTLTITSVSGSMYASYEIGTLLKNEPVQLPIQDLSAGLYYLRIISDEGVFHTIISKQ